MVPNMHGRKLKLREATDIDQSLTWGDLAWAAQDCELALSQVQSKTDHIPGCSLSTKTLYVPPLLTRRSWAHRAQMLFALFSLLFMG